MTLLSRLQFLNPDFKGEIPYILTKWSETKGVNLYQTWKTKKLPDLTARYCDVWKEKYKDRYHFITDKDLDLIMLSVGGNLYDKYKKYENRIQQIDLFRYVLIYLVGGIYLDIDVAMVKDSCIDDISGNNPIFPIELMQNTDHCLQNRGINILIGNYAFYSPKGHPFLLELIKEIIKGAIPECEIPDIRSKQILYTTGPVAVTKIYFQSSHKESVILVKKDPFQSRYFGNWGYHLQLGSWRKK